MKTRGSQISETLPEYGSNAVAFDGKTLITEDIKTGEYEKWQRNDDFAGYVLEFCNMRFEFVSSI